MTDYQRKQENVEAFRVPEGYAITVDTVSDDTDDAVQSAVAGEYVVVDQVAGTVRIMSADDFHAQYEPRQSGSFGAHPYWWYQQYPNNGYGIITIK